MTYLHIPLGRMRTARHHRRAVWLWVAIMVFWTFAAWFVTSVWFTRDSLSGYAPTQTVAVIHLTPTKSQWNRLMQDFGHVPLVSRQFLTLRELSKLPIKELAVFLDSSGEYSLALRANLLKDEQRTLEAYGISVQELKGDRYLLSAKPVPFSTNSRSRFRIGTLSPFAFGTLRLYEDNNNSFSSSLIIGRDQYTVSLPNVQAESLPLHKLPENISTALSSPGLTNDAFQSLEEQLASIIDASNSDPVSSILQSISSSGTVMVFTEGERQDFFLRTAKKVPHQELLRSIASLKNPRTRAVLLPDGSQSMEMFVEPSNITVEELVVAGKTVSRVQTPDGPYLALEDENWLYVATNEELFSRWFMGSEEGNTTISCHRSPFVVIDTKKTASSLLRGQMERSVSSTSLVQSFNKISLHSALFSTKMVLCQ